MNTASHIKASDLTPDFVNTFHRAHKNEDFVLVPERDYEAMATAWHNAEYLAKLDRSFQELEEGKVVVKTMEELEEMAR